MTKHIVFFKLSNQGKISQNEIVVKLKSLQNKIPYIINLEVGINFSQEQRAYDISLIVDLISKEDLIKYANDPYHLEVISFLKSMDTVTKVVDYETL